MSGPLARHATRMARVLDKLADMLVAGLMIGSLAVLVCWLLAAGHGVR